MLNVLLTGTLIDAPDAGYDRNGTASTTARVRVDMKDGERLVAYAIAYDARSRTAFATMGQGEPVAIVGHASLAVGKETGRPTMNVRVRRVIGLCDASPELRELLRLDPAEGAEAAGG